MARLGLGSKNRVRQIHAGEKSAYASVTPEYIWLGVLFVYYTGGEKNKNEVE